MFNVSALLLDDALKPRATPLTNGAINETLRQFVPLSDDTLEVHVVGSLVIVLYKFSPDFDSEMI